MFTIMLYVSLGLLTAGLVYKLSGWFTRQVGLWPVDSTPGERLTAAVRGIAGVLLSGRVLTLLRTFGRDVVLQRHILAQAPRRWIMHMLIFVPFVLLLLMHGLDQLVTARLFSNYMSTLNPYFLMRDLLGLLVAAGLVLAVWRRAVKPNLFFKTSGRDGYGIAIVAVIIASGFLLQSAKMVSPVEFQEMIFTYSATDEPDELDALEAFWVDQHGLFSARLKPPFDESLLVLGAEIHQMECAYCHAPASSALASFSLGKLLKPLAPAMDRRGGITLLYWLHVLACFAGLAYLPFSKLLHLITTPLSLLVRSVMHDDTAQPLNIATRQALELDACMHCSTCSRHCSVRGMAESLNNPLILPAEKLAFLKGFDPTSKSSREALPALRQALYVCTNCDRCTINCPAGINLRELWWQVRERLLRLDGIEPLVLTPLSLFRSLRRTHRLMDAHYAHPQQQALAHLAPGPAATAETLILSAPAPLPEALQQATTFLGCFGCCTCTTVCPVVQCCDMPETELGLLPHQIMNCLALGLTDLAATPAMLYNCTTCGQCQEHCPQQVEVMDILYQLKQLATSRAGASSQTSAPHARHKENPS